MKSISPESSVRPDLVDDGIHRLKPQPSRRDRSISANRPPVLYINEQTREQESATVLTDQTGGETKDVHEAVAKRVIDREGVHYFVKFSTNGYDRDHMLNVLGMYYRPNDMKRDDVRLGRLRYEFRRVPSESFYDYIEFLKTKNEAFLRRAERRILDA